MDNFFESIQAASRSKATIDNYARREKQFFEWLKIDSPDCWDANDLTCTMERVTAAMMCKFISEQSVFTSTRKMKAIIQYLFIFSVGPKFSYRELSKKSGSNSRRGIGT